jgi:hypothetical protein
VKRTEIIAEAIRELIDVLDILRNGADQQETLAQVRIIERQCEELREAAEVLRRQA